MKVELEIISDIVDTRSNKPKVLVKNDKIKKLFDLDSIEVEEFIDSKTGKHIKKYSSVYFNNTYYKVNKPYAELSFLIINKRMPVIGLIGKSNGYKHPKTF